MSVSWRPPIWRRRSGSTGWSPWTRSDPGRRHACGTQEATERTDRSRSAFIALLPEASSASINGTADPAAPLCRCRAGHRAHGLTRRFGDFTAVDHVSFAIERGEIFGFVGSNGCGKTTTMKMLTGLLPASEGEVLLFGRPLDASDLEAAQPRRLYVAVVLALYRADGSAEPRASRALVPPAGAQGEGAHCRIDRPLRPCRACRPAGLDLPLGIRQRLSLAVAVVHEPEMLILDEPTSGVDPVARDRFWELLIDLSRNQGVTIFVSTHFMNEAERCDRISLMDFGRVLATDTPAGLIKARGAATLEDAFIAYLEEASKPHAVATSSEAPFGAPPRPNAEAPHPSFRLQRLFACTIRETLELARDPIRLGFALFGTTFLMLVFGFGISTDVNNLAFAVLDRDRRHESRAYLEEMRGSAYFRRETAARGLCRSRAAAGRAGNINPAIEIPPGFRPRHRARAAGVGRLLGRWRAAVRRADDPRLSARHASALSRRPGG